MVCHGSRVIVGVDPVLLPALQRCGLTTGSPAARQAANPPARSVARGRPMSWSEAAANEEAYPSWQTMMGQS